MEKLIIINSFINKFVLIVRKLQNREIRQYREVVQWGQLTIIKCEVLNGGIRFDEIFDIFGDLSDGNAV